MKLYHVIIYDKHNERQSFCVNAKTLVDARKAATKTKKELQIKGFVASVFKVTP